MERYTISISAEAGKIDRYSAKELSDYLIKSVGCKTSIEINKKLLPHQLLLSTKNFCPKSYELSSTKGLSKEGYSIKIASKSVCVSGIDARGLLYGVYSFLEDHIGCRWYAIDCQYIPRISILHLLSRSYSYSPLIKWRSILYYEMSDPYLSGVLKLNGNAQQQSEVNKNRFSIRERFADWGYWCHSLYNIVPPSLYDTHPEYFSEVKGKRIVPEEGHGGTQLCLSNSDIVNISVNKLKEVMKIPQKGLPIWADSIAYYWSVSQMDGEGYCTCPNCKALDDYNNSHSGSILSFVNKVASYFPNKKIATLAYIYSRKTPLHIKPASNVAIQLCAIETARNGINFPISKSPIHTSFRKDMVNWGKICNDIIIWDYVIQFQNLISPFPNFNVMQDNIRFYSNNHATGIFCQGNREKGGEFAELRSYLLSKLLWNPNCNVKQLMNDFINTYYGAAGQYIKKYISKMESALSQSGKPLSMDENPEQHSGDYLSKACIDEYNRLFNKAEAAIKNDSTFLRRVQKERMSLIYAQIRLKYGTPTERQSQLDYLYQLAIANNIWMFSEVDWRPDQTGNREMMKEKMKKFLE